MAAADVDEIIVNLSEGENEKSSKKAALTSDPNVPTKRRSEKSNWWRNSDAPETNQQMIETEEVSTPTVRSSEREASEKVFEFSLQSILRQQRKNERLNDLFHPVHNIKNNGKKTFTKSQVYEHTILVKWEQTDRTKEKAPIWPKLEKTSTSLAQQQQDKAMTMVINGGGQHTTSNTTQMRFLTSSKPIVMPEDPSTITKNEEPKAQLEKQLDNTKKITATTTLNPQAKFYLPQSSSHHLSEEYHQKQQQPSPDPRGLHQQYNPDYPPPHHQQNQRGHAAHENYTKEAAAAAYHQQQQQGGHPRPPHHYSSRGDQQRNQPPPTAQRSSQHPRHYDEQQHQQQQPPQHQNQQHFQQQQQHKENPASSQSENYRKHQQQQESYFKQKQHDAYSASNSRAGGPPPPHSSPHLTQHHPGQGGHRGGDPYSNKAPQQHASPSRHQPPPPHSSPSYNKHAGGPPHNGGHHPPSHHLDKHSSNRDYYYKRDPYAQEKNPYSSQAEKNPYSSQAGRESEHSRLTENPYDLADKEPYYRSMRETQAKSLAASSRGDRTSAGGHQMEQAPMLKDRFPGYPETNAPYGAPHPEGYHNADYSHDAPYHYSRESSGPRERQGKSSNRSVARAAEVEEYRRRMQEREQLKRYYERNGANYASRSQKPISRGHGYDEHASKEERIYASYAERRAPSGYEEYTSHRGSAGISERYAARHGESYHSAAGTHGRSGRSGRPTSDPYREAPAVESQYGDPRHRSHLSRSSRQPQYNTGERSSRSGRGGGHEGRPGLVHAVPHHSSSSRSHRDPYAEYSMEDYPRSYEEERRRREQIRHHSEYYGQTQNRV